MFINVYIYIPLSKLDIISGVMAFSFGSEVALAFVPPVSSIAPDLVDLPEYDE
jgi:hypothetical protein